MIQIKDIDEEVRSMKNKSVLSYLGRKSIISSERLVHQSFYDNTNVVSSFQGGKIIHLGDRCRFKHTNCSFNRSIPTEKENATSHN